MKDIKALEALEKELIQNADIPFKVVNKVRHLIHQTKKEGIQQTVDSKMLETPQKSLLNIGKFFEKILNGETVPKEEYKDFPDWFDNIKQALQQPTDSEVKKALEGLKTLQHCNLEDGIHIQIYEVLRKALTKEDNVPTKSAKDMFEELGYKKFYIEHALVWENEYADSVEFYDGLLYSVDENIKIGMELHKAITQQLKELEK